MNHKEPLKNTHLCNNRMICASDMLVQEKEWREVILRRTNIKARERLYRTHAPVAMDIKKEKEDLKCYEKWQELAKNNKHIRKFNPKCKFRGRRIGKRAAAKNNQFKSWCWWENTKSFKFHKIGSKIWGPSDATLEKEWKRQKRTRRIIKTSSFLERCGQDIVIDDLHEVELHMETWKKKKSSSEFSGNRKRRWEEDDATAVMSKLLPLQHGRSERHEQTDLDRLLMLYETAKWNLLKHAEAVQLTEEGCVQLKEAVHSPCVSSVRTLSL